MTDRSELALQLTGAIAAARAAVEHAGDRAFRTYGLSHRAHAVLTAVDAGGPDGARPKEIAAQLGGDLFGAGAVRTARVHGRQDGVGAVREAIGPERPVAGVLHGRPCGGDGPGELESKLGTIGHQLSVLSSQYKVNMLIVNILSTSHARKPCFLTTD